MHFEHRQSAGVCAAAPADLSTARGDTLLLLSSKNINSPLLPPSPIGGDPKLKEYLSDPTFMSKIEMLQKNPNSLQMMMGDPRIMEVLQLALGGNVSFGNPDEAPEAPKKEPEKKKVRSWLRSPLNPRSILSLRFAPRRRYAR